MRFAFAFALLAACSTSSPSPTPTGPPPNVDPPLIECTVPRPIAQLDAGSPADGGDGSADDASDGGTGTNEPADASPPSATECQLPPATCADSNWLAYFDDGQCIAGKCLLTTKYHFCPSGCSNTAYKGAGGCNQPVHNGPTAPAPPNRF